MKKNLILGAGRGPRLEVLEQLKRSPHGMTVKDLSAAMGMSYMGVKAHCLTLAEAGYLSTRREPAPKGRPYMFYKLSDSGERFFAESSQEIALDLLKESKTLFGSSAPQKLLMMYFRSLAARYRGMIEEEGDVSGVERARLFVRIREKEGRMSSLIEGEGQGEWKIRESHNTLSSILKAYPESVAMEEQMVGEVLHIGIKRHEEGRAVIFSPR